MRRAVGTGVLAIGLLVPFIPLLLWAVAGEFRYPAVVPELSGRGLGLILDPAVLDALLTSLAIAGAVAVLAALIGVGAGRALGLYAFRGRRFIQFLLLAPAIVPTLAVTLGIQVYFIRYGLADSVAGVVIVQLVPTVPYVSLVMASAFANFDVESEDAAGVLGRTAAAVAAGHVTRGRARPRGGRPVRVPHLLE